MTSTIASSVLSSMNSTTATADSTTSAADDLQDQFLTLLTTQLQNQDPTDPMDNSEMVTQLAQISTISSIENVTSTLEGISSQISAAETLQASALVGNGVLIDGNTLLVGDVCDTCDCDPPPPPPPPPVRAPEPRLGGRPF